MEFFFIYLFTSFKLMLIITVHYINTANKTAEMGTRPQIVAKKHKESGLTVWQNDNRRTGTLRKGENV